MPVKLFFKMWSALKKWKTRYVDPAAKYAKYATYAGMGPYGVAKFLEEEAKHKMKTIAQNPEEELPAYLEQAGEYFERGLEKLPTGPVGIAEEFGPEFLERWEQTGHLL